MTTECVSEGWVQIAEEMYAMMEERGDITAAVDAERLQYFLMSLLLNEINFNNRDTMPLLI